MTTNPCALLASHTVAKESWIKEIDQTSTLKDLENLRVKFLGKSGEITSLLKNLGSLPADQRKEYGAAVNILKSDVQERLEQQRLLLEEKALNLRLQEETLDITLPVREFSVGTIHPITKTLEAFMTYFKAHGFEVVYGPDIEDEEHNFTALNIPAHHPARQSQDTLYFPGEPGTGGRTLLRTQTSPVQIRTMRSKKPPLRLISPGRVYRSDNHDATHSSMFHQVEGLVIDKNIHFGHLKHCVADFCQYFFDVSQLETRFRPSFFPFTEPSGELDIRCDRQKDFIKIGTGADWLEMGGCGMVHPKVLENCGIDSTIYQGFAFGFGVERFAMLKYGISDLRAMYEGDVRWLRHFGFSPWHS